MTANQLSLRAFLSFFLARLLPLLGLALAGAAALAQADPPARVGNLSHLDGSVVLAPAGDTEWTEAVLNRPVTRGDRLWTDPGARAELHLGSAVLHLADQTFLDVTALDDKVLQASLNEGSVNARVRRLDAGENFEIDTPNLAFRAAQPGDYRVDVDPGRGATRVTVRSGLALVYGASGQSQQVHPGQQLAFGGRDLERVALPPLRGEEFDQWAAERNRREDQAIAARYVPRDVVGYHQLDPYGSWVQDPTYGAVWFPRITVADWAPYRYGHWEWIRPWGWTWIDDAPWGFAPFHYGRWAVIGSRWCWVPGRIGPRPIYAPALVAFVGGGSGTSWSLTIGSGPGIAWYPLAPGEAWRPFYSASSVYVRNVNRHIGAGELGNRIHIHQRRPDAVTAIGTHDFSRGRPVHRHWSRVNPADLARAPLATPPVLPEPSRPPHAGRAVPPRAQPPVHSPAPAIVGQPPWRGPGFGSREDGRQPPARRRDEQRLVEPPRGQPHARQEERREQRIEERRERFEERQDERRAREEQRRQQAQQPQSQQQERARRDQQMRAQRDQQLQVQRQMEEQRRAQQAQMQREHAQRQQQEAQERMQRQQQAAQERNQRQQQAAQERIQRQQEMQQRAQQQLSGPPRGQGRDSGEERRRQAQERHDQRRPPHGEEGRGRGQGQGRGG